MNMLPNYGITMAQPSVAFRAQGLQAALSENVLPKAQLSLIKNFDPVVLKDIANSITNRDVDVTSGLSQFSQADQNAIKEALATGDLSGLPAYLKTWVEAQIAQKEASFMAQAEQQKAELEQQLAAEASARQEALDKQAKDKADLIKAQHNKQALVYGAVFLAGVALIGGLYYKGRK